MTRIVAAATLVLLAGSASAADLPARPAYKAPSAAASDWTGFYFGAHAGHVREDPSAIVDASSLEPLVPNLNPVLSTSTPPFTLSVTPQSWLAGLQAGYNWQSGPFVFGLEADVSWTRLQGEASGAYAVVGTTLNNDGENFAGTVRLTHSIDVLGTLRARAGYTAGPWLLYATGGLAFAHMETTLTSRHVATLAPATFPPGYPEALNGSASVSGVRWGYTLGGGAEWEFTPQWSLRGEYLYLHIDSPSLAIPGAWLSGDAITMHVARIGLNYRFRGL